MRIAAPVGQRARTRARRRHADAGIALHCFLAFLLRRRARLVARRSPGPLPPSISHDSKRFFGASYTMRMTPYGQFAWQLPQPMHESLM